MTRQHTDREYEAELRRLRELLLLTGAKVEEMLQKSMQALVQRDSALALRMIEADREVNRLEVEIDDSCLRVLARRQPVASDLRFITMCLKVVTDLERMGDLAVNICERVAELNEDLPLSPPQVVAADLPRMAAAVQAMLREALDAFVAADPGRAQRILEQDRAVDAYYVQIFRALLGEMMADPAKVARCMKLQSIAKHLERIGDHATNLAEMVVFMVRGKDIRHTGKLDRQERRSARPPRGRRAPSR